MELCHDTDTALLGRNAITGRFYLGILLFPFLCMYYQKKGEGKEMLPSLNQKLVSNYKKKRA